MIRSSASLPLPFLSARPCGRDLYAARHNHRNARFLSARPCGRDRAMAVILSFRWLFLSARPCGRDRVQIQDVRLPLVVSIRAPVRTRPRALARMGRCCFGFYPRARADATPDRRDRRPRPSCFYPRARADATDLILTHTSSKKLFLSARPCGRDRPRMGRCLARQTFLSARPCGRDRPRCFSSELSQQVSIRAPVRTRPGCGCIGKSRSSFLSARPCGRDPPSAWLPEPG